MKQKRILILGASSGYGLSITKNFLKNGHSVRACSRHATSSHNLTDLLTEYPKNLKIDDLNVLSQLEIETFFNSLKSEKVFFDEIYYTVGKSQTTYYSFPLSVVDKKYLFDMLDINAYSALNVLKSSLEVIDNMNYPTFVFFSSTAATSSKPGHGVYNVSKLLLNGLMMNYSSELKERGIPLRIFGVDPWEAQTGMNKDSDINPDHILQILEVISACKSWLKTGQIFFPDGNNVIFPGAGINPMNLYKMHRELFSEVRTYDYNKFKFGQSYNVTQT